MTTSIQQENRLHNKLEKLHNSSPFSTYLREIVYGGNDGIVTTFAVVAGFAGAQSSMTGALPIAAVLLFGLANLFADGASMALGNFLSIRSDQDVYASEKKIELEEIKLTPQHEIEETVEIFEKKGYTPQDAKTLARLLVKNPSYWAEFMLHDEHQMTNPENDNPFFSALATLISFLFFGFIPLFPYVLMPASLAHFGYSVLFTAIALLTLGFMRYKVTKISLTRSLLEVVFLGGTAAMIAYFVGTFFRI